MTAAVDLVENPNLDIDPITATTSTGKPTADDELAHFHVGPTDIEKLVLNLRKFSAHGNKVHANVRQVVTDCVIEDSIDKTPTFTISIHDPDWQLLNSGALDGAVDINPGGIPHRWYRLDTFNVTDDDIDLVFSTRNAVFLSMHKKPYKISRGKVTRALFIQTLLHHVKIVKIPFYCPQLRVKQKQAKYTSSSEKQKKENRDSGFTASDKLTVKGVPATSSQRKVISAVIEAGKDVKAPGLVIVAALMTIAQESSAGANTTGNPPYVGSFQQNPGDGWPATGDPYKDAVGNHKLGQKQGGFYGWAIPIWNSDPGQELGQFVAKVQGVVGSTNPLNNGYAQSADKWRAESEHSVNAFGGIEVDDPGTVGTTTTDYRAKYEFMVGPDDGPKNENYLAAIYRLAGVVNWSAYWVRDVLHYMSQEDLFKAKARVRLRRYQQGVEGVTFGYDRSKKVNQMTLTVRMDRWVAPVGTVVIWDEGSTDTGKGRWLVTNIRRSVFDQKGEIILSKPMAEKKEPAPQSATHKSSDDPTSSTFDGTAPVDVGKLSYPLAVQGDFIQGPGAGNASYEGSSQGTHKWGGQFSNWQSCNAVDIGCPKGTDVFAVADGTVVRLGGSWDGTGNSNPNGYNFTFQQDNGPQWFYTHMEWRGNFQIGQRVKKGQLIGHSGAANGVWHLHLGVSNGNPQTMLKLKN